MALKRVDETGDLWFISSASSHKNKEIKQDDKVQLIFAKTSSLHYLSVFGEADIFKDKSKLDEIWTPIAKAWFKDGKRPRCQYYPCKAARILYRDTVRR